MAIVGAGALGLVAALRLAQRGHAVSVFEAAPRVGGLATSFFPSDDSDPLECFYHHLFKTDHAIVALFFELGLASRLIWKRPATSLLYDGALERVDGAASLMRFHRLSVADRLRLGAALAILKLAPSAAPFEDRSAISWLEAVAGDPAARIVFRPLFASKFGSYAEEISLAWLWARVHDRTTWLGYPLGGFNALYDALARGIRALGGEVITEAPVQSIRSSAVGLQVTAAHSDTQVFDRALATIPLRRLGGIAPELPQNFIEKHESRSFLGARCLVVALDRQLTNAYWIAVSDASYPFLVAVEHTNFIDVSRYGGAHVVYFGSYRPEFPSRSAAELLDEFGPHIRTLNPAFERSWIRDAWLFEAHDAQPIVTPGYAKQIPPHRTPLRGLYIANLHHTYPHDRGQNYAVALGTKVANLIDADVKS